mgnify:CR=1 FL=1
MYKRQVNDTITANEPTEKFLKKWCPNTPITRPFGEFEAPLSNRKTREVLGFLHGLELVVKGDLLKSSYPDFHYDRAPVPNDTALIGSFNVTATF